MTDKYFLDVDDIIRLTGVSKTSAYKLIKTLNSKIQENGGVAITGKVSRQFFEEMTHCIISEEETQDN